MVICRFVYSGWTTFVGLLFCCFLRAMNVFVRSYASYHHYSIDRAANVFGDYYSYYSI